MFFAPSFIFISAVAPYPFTNKFIIRWVLKSLYFAIFLILFWIHLEIHTNFPVKCKMFCGSQPEDTYSSASRMYYLTLLLCLRRLQYQQGCIWMYLMMCIIRMYPFSFYFIHFSKTVLWLQPTKCYFHKPFILVTKNRCHSILHKLFLDLYKITIYPQSTCRKLNDSFLSMKKHFFISHET